MEGKAYPDKENGPGIERGAPAPPPINQEENDMLNDTLYLTLQITKIAALVLAAYVVTYLMLAI